MKIGDSVVCISDEPLFIDKDDIVTVVEIKEYGVIIQKGDSIKLLYPSDYFKEISE